MAGPNPTPLSVASPGLPLSAGSRCVVVLPSGRSSSVVSSSRHPLELEAAHAYACMGRNKRASAQIELLWLSQQRVGYEPPPPPRTSSFPFINAGIPAASVKCHGTEGEIPAAAVARAAKKSLARPCSHAGGVALTGRRRRRAESTLDSRIFSSSQGNRPEDTHDR